MILFGKKDQPSRNAYAVVTGAGSGIGRSFAVELAKRGGNVVCADINLEAAKETVKLIEQLGQKAFAVQCDVGQAEQVQALADQAEQLLDHPVTLIINNAGVGLGGKFDEMSLEDWKWCMHVNLWGVIHGCHAFVPKLKKLGYGAIINVASAASYTAAPEMSVYNVTKAGVLALSETLSAELRKFNIKVNVLCPTLVPTNIIKNGRIPGRYSKLADHALMNYAMTTSDAVAALTLNRLDRGQLYTTPQIDAKLFWLMKRTSPTLYAKFLGLSYQLFK
ncbi:short chain dehydrogenase family protein [Acinetobacter sp. 1130196]|jgi:short-subunit dehydrogenase|uniref:SDR family NAD(P)-dependent oxidoreductase n=7 Tax=Acinetobacter calcoaceticus/baumannii complex TaxID=909768 RepID=A0A3G6Z104_ACINO|nr:MULTISPECIES: SDR family NAD(P)-dependent oxidoreductase [Acinetobacter]KCZ34404.1 short chain dehydrogenase family protein [Acinetobacter baumannii 25977_9]SSQ41579.1 Oxidoreductase short chain dehydrogenase/reductase family [Acinetobacter baumannii]AZC02884.1 SDR family NAD(P)-dependent oxidoreductase [Acinetobacter nosocomialis]AZC04717.1 SDR family NAD(P)-dependent oxidoreductase [Acinetobacter nosocomialis]AZC06422.1 SDR family NAD(P)-dependent oxidoreductase [Acinetobacter nosocomiali